MEVVPTSISGCFELRPRIFSDDRGTFVKTFHRDTFAKLGLATDFPEQFYSVSRKGVLRGLHFQTPPHEQAKLVTCTAGEVMDVAVDLRRGSPTYGKHAIVELSGERGNMIYIPSGMAHGFYTLSDSATLLYNATAQHSPANDSGIRWDSAAIAWPDRNPIVSARDAAFAPLADFKTSFLFG